MPILLRSTGSFGEPSLKASMASRYILRAMKMSPRFSADRTGLGVSAWAARVPSTMELGGIVPVCANPRAALMHAARVTDRGRLTIWPPCCYLNTRHNRWRNPFFSAGFLVSSFGDAGGGAVEFAAWPAAWRAARREAGSGGACPSPCEPGIVGAARAGGGVAGGGLVSHPATVVMPPRPPCRGQTPTGSVPAM